MAFTDNTFLCVYTTIPLLVIYFLVLITITDILLFLIQYTDTNVHLGRLDGDVLDDDGLEAEVLVGLGPEFGQLDDAPGEVGLADDEVDGAAGQGHGVPDGLLVGGRVQAGDGVVQVKSAVGGQQAGHCGRK